MRRQAVLAAVGVALLAGGVSSRAATPGYLTPGNFSISLGPTWEGAHKVAGVAYSPTVASREPNGGWVWAASCTADSQTVNFTREVELLGSPVQARLNWNVASQGTTLESFELDVNRRPVARWADPMARNTIDLTKKALSAFHPGTNLLTVRATRPALARGVKGCSIAVSFAFEGAFATDLRVSVPKEKVIYTHRTRALITEFVVNEGKTTSLDASLKITNAGQYELITGSTEGISCRATSKNEEWCPLKPLAPGAKATVLVSVSYAAGAAGWDHYSGIVQFSVIPGTLDPKTNSVIPGTPDPNSLNNYVNVNIMMCEKGSREPSCVNATD